ncbi:MAG: hypothetical protein WDM85_10465 [Caulobacteraceae bacterium]
MNYPIEVSGLNVGTIGVKSYDVAGRVYNLHRLADIEGTYSAAEASATAGAGGRRHRHDQRQRGRDPRLLHLVRPATDAGRGRPSPSG